MRERLLLAIESSCDESAVALVRGGREVLAERVASQTAIHAPFGGVIPEVAARAHHEWLPRLLNASAQCRFNRQLRRTLELSGCHHQRIFAIIVVVANASAHFSKAECSIESLSVTIGNAHIQRCHARPTSARLLEELEEEHRRDASPAIRREYRHRRDVRFVHHQPDATKANERAVDSCSHVAC